MGGGTPGPLPRPPEGSGQVSAVTIALTRRCARRRQVPVHLSLQQPQGQALCPMSPRLERATEAQRTYGQAGAERRFELKQP